MPYRYVSRERHLNLSKHSVLVVEDHKATQRILGEVLRSLGFGYLHYVEDVEMAIRTLRRFPIDLLLTDIIVTGGSGLALIERVRQDIDPKVSTIPIVVVSAHATLAFVIKAGGVGADGFVAKPVSVKALALRIGEALRTTRALRTGQMVAP